MQVTPDSTQLPIRSHAVAGALVAGWGEAARILVLQRAKNTSRDLWSLVMGRIEPGESAAETIRREITEETGIPVEALYTSGCCDIFFNAKSNSVEVMPIFVALFDKVPDVALDDEHQAYRWLTFAEAIDLLAYPGQRQALPEIKRDFADRAPPEFRLIRDK